MMMAIIMSVFMVVGVNSDLRIVYECTPTHKLPTLKHEISVNDKTLRIYKGACYEL